ncbi:glycosyltransferase family 2 protein [Tolypothrix campylonemoides VB511288]|nr:glycosyltransferase family 2 protein [Tolypothrix campylonemoides VB511288]
MQPQSHTGLVSVVTPVYGCAGCLEALVERVKLALDGVGQPFELLLVDDGSPDRSWDRIRDLAMRFSEVRGLRLARNFGQHSAIAAGLAHSRGSHVVVMDCDLQDAPEEIPNLLAVARTGVDVVLAQRSMRRDGLAKRLASYGFHRILAWLTGVPQDHTVANFGVYSRKVVDALASMPEVERVFPLMVRWAGFPEARVPVVHAERASGRSGYSIGKLLRLALHIVLSYSDKPLRLVVKMGLTFAAAAVVIVCLSIWRYLVGDVQVAGFTSIIASIWLLGSVMILCIGLVGLYVGRLFNESKRRPSFLVRDDTSEDA